MLFLQEFIARVNVAADAKITPDLARYPEAGEDDEVVGVISDPVLLALVAVTFTLQNEAEKKWSQKPTDESDVQAMRADAAIVQLEGDIMFCELQRAVGGYDAPGVGLRRRGDELVLVKIYPNPIDEIVRSAIAETLGRGCDDPDCPVHGHLYQD